jgi:mono/diheme cytochrome c family protein
MVDERTPGRLDAAYKVLAWASLAFMTLVVAYLLSLVLRETPATTSAEAQLSRARATQTILAAAYAPSSAAADADGVVPLPPTCATCHRIEGTAAAGTLGPDLTHGATAAAAQLASPGYGGAATDVEQYIRESIVDPNAYVLEGPGWRTTTGASTMPAASADVLSPHELDRLVRYLAGLE